MCVLQQLRKLLLLALQLRVAANVLLANEDIWHCALMGHVFQGILELGAIVDLVEFDDVCLHSHVAEERLGSLAIGAVRLREDGYQSSLATNESTRRTIGAEQIPTNCIVVDDALGFGFCGHDCTWTWGASEEFLSVHIVSKKVCTKLVGMKTYRKLMVGNCCVGQLLCGPSVVWIEHDSFTAEKVGFMSARVVLYSSLL